MASFPSHVPPTRRASPRYDARSNGGVISHAAFVVLVIGLATALILIVLVAGELRGRGSQVAHHFAQATISQMDMPRPTTAAMAQQ